MAITKARKKEMALIVLGLFIIIISVFLVAYSLTFLIKNINLILRPNLNQDTNVHFNLEEAQKIFSSSTPQLNH